MFTSVSTGESVLIGEFITLTVLAIDGDEVRLALDFSGPGDPDTGTMTDGDVESDWIL